MHVFQVIFLTEDKQRIDSILNVIEEWKNKSQYVICSTSGSTGKPKRIKIDKKHIVNSAKATSDFFHFNQTTTLLHSLSTETIGGKMQVFRGLIYGLSIYVSDVCSNPIKNLAVNIDFATFAPLQLESILAKNSPKLNLIKTILLGGAHVSSKLKKSISSINTEVYEGYGMTETISHVAIRNLKTDTAVFHSMSHSTFGIREEKLIINAPLLGIHDLKTNDLVQLIDEKSFKWIGRADFVINSGGIKIHPEQLEQKLESKIKERFFIFKEPNESFGEIVVLVIEDSFSIEKQDDYKKTCLTLLDKKEVPKKIYFQKKFIQTNSGKINRIASFQLIQVNL